MAKPKLICRYCHREILSNGPGRYALTSPWKGWWVLCPGNREYSFGEYLNSDEYRGRSPDKNAHGNWPPHHEPMPSIVRLAIEV